MQQRERETTWRTVILVAGAECGLPYLTDLVTAALERELPILQGDPGLLEAARSSSAANVAMIVEQIRGEFRAEDFTAPPQALVFARELARRNVEVAELGRAYRLAQHALWRWAIGEARARISDGDALAAAIEGLSDAAFVTGDILSTMMMERYATEREQWRRSADAVRLDAVRRVLAGDVPDPSAVSGQLGYRLVQEHQAFVVWAEQEDANPEHVAALVGGAAALVLPLGAGLIGGWAVPGAIDVAIDTAGVGVALGAPGHGSAGFRRSHREALEARRVAALVGHPGAPVRYDDVALLALLTKDVEQAREFATRTLGPRAGDDESARRLATTLLAVLEEQGSPRRAGQRLGIHENTVAKRLRAIEDRGGPVVAHSGPRAAELMAALLILRALRTSPDGIGTLTN